MLMTVLGSSISCLTGLVLIPASLAVLATLGYALVYVDTWVRCDDQNSLTCHLFTALNAVREKLGRSPVWLAPAAEPESGLIKQASHTLSQIQQALHASPLSGDRKRQVQWRARRTVRSIADSVWQLHRLRRLNRLHQDYAQAGDQEISRMQTQLVGEMQRSLQALQTLPVSLMTVELERGSACVERSLSDLSEADERLHDLVGGYQAVRRGALWIEG